MTEVWFYHLESKTLDQVLPDLLERTLSRGWRAVVRAGSPERVTALDSHLWTYRDDSFLPHGTAAEGNEDIQPIFLTSGIERPNQASVLFLVDGAGLDGAGDYDRCVDIFDGRDEGAVAAARDRWRQAKSFGFAVTYWQQNEEGRWEKKA
jgi:DNA polymerase-3 subunit chi